MRQNIKRYIARFLVEAATPLAVGSGNKGLTIDRLVVKDANGLPFIPGTSLAGVVRHELNAAKEAGLDHLFGHQLSPAAIREKAKEDGIDLEKVVTGQGSRICFSAAHLTDAGGQDAIEGLQIIDFTDPYFSLFQNLPERDHVRITDKGVADRDKGGKFDEQLVPKGARFVFEIELQGTDADESIWGKLLSAIHQPLFRIGAGTRNGFGKLDIISCKHHSFDLTDIAGDLATYLDRDSSLNNDCSGWADFDRQTDSSSDWIAYEIDLMPDDYFLFGAGYGDGDADMQPKRERYIAWMKEETDQSWSAKEEERLLIPATSIKGALSHRVAYHYNRLTGVTLSTDFKEKEVKALPTLDHESALDRFFNNKTVKELESLNVATFFEQTSWEQHEEALREYEQKNKHTRVLPIQESNKAVRTLFGYAKEEVGKTTEGARGHVILSDFYQKFNRVKESKRIKESKMFNHVAIDRFTGGGIDGALYKEQVVTCTYFSLCIYVAKEAFKEADVRAAFELALKDLISGQLQLGGNTSKGHGAFDGRVTTKDPNSSFYKNTQQ